MGHLDWAPPSISGCDSQHLQRLLDSSLLWKLFHCAWTTQLLITESFRDRTLFGQTLASLGMGFFILLVEESSFAGLWEGTHCYFIFLSLPGSVSVESFPQRQRWPSSRQELSEFCLHFSCFLGLNASQRASDDLLIINLLVSSAWLQELLLPGWISTAFSLMGLELKVAIK